MEKVLFIKTNPIDTVSLRLETEEKKIREVLERSSARDNFQFETRGAVTKQNLLQYLLSVQPQVLHISGHGSEDSALFFEDNEGYKEEIPIDKFSSFLSNFKEHIHCVFLNSCHSLSNVSDFNDDIPYIIGMKKEIPDDVAISFSSSFYASYFNGRPVMDSFKIALDMISLTSFDDELIPQIVENKAQVTNETSQAPTQEADEHVTLVSDADIQLMKTSMKKEKQLLRSIMMFAISLSVLIISYALFNSDPSEEYLIGGLIPGFLSYLPIIKVGKKNQSLQLLNVFEHKRNRILKALSVISDDEIDKLNEEFYRIVSIKTA
jgi:hypothetical protein